MILSQLPQSYYDERRNLAIVGDSSARSSLFKVENGRTSYGSFSSAADLKDYYRISPGIGTFTLYVTTDARNGFATSVAATSFDLSITDSAGNVLLGSSAFQGDSYSRYITFTSQNTNSYWIEVSNTAQGSFQYAASMATTDRTVPTVAAFTPADGATGIAGGANIVLVFSEAIRRGTGNIVLKTASGTTVETFNAATSPRLSIAGDTLTIDPSALLAANTGYKVEFAAGTVTDLAGNAYAGTTSYDFTTAASATAIGPTVSIADNLVGTANSTTTTLSYALTFNKAVTGLDATDFTVTNGTVTAVSGSGTAWSVRVTPRANTASGSIGLTLNAGAVTDAQGNPNNGATRANQPIDTVAPSAPVIRAQATFRTVADPQVTLNTSLGTVVFELDPAHAPISVGNMLDYVNDGFYSNTLFHRVIQDFMVQGGGFTTGMVAKSPTYAPIPLESANGLSNLRGTLAMARTSVADSGTSQFYVNLIDNPFLDYTNASSPGYAVFGRVISGMEVIDAIATATTGTAGGYENVPQTDISISGAAQTQTGSSVARAGLVFVDGIESGARWEYSINNGSTWRAGTGASFTLPVGNYAPHAVQVRQTDAAGNVSATVGRTSGILIVETTAPTVQSYSPADGGTAVAVDANIVLTFSEAIQRGVGSIVLKTAAGAIVETFDAAVSDRLTVAGSTLTIDPTADLARGTGYYVVLRPGAVRDLAGNAYTGTAAYDFSTLGNPISGTAAGERIYGTALGEPIEGGEGNDTLDGRAGADALSGGGGNDTYLIDQSGDSIVEGADGGTDTALIGIATAGTSWTLAANLENATLSSAVTGSLTGNELDNALTGNNAANTLTGGDGNDSLDGRGGADSLVGGAGNDSYAIDLRGDAIVEAASGGTDSVLVGITLAGAAWTLVDNLENATLAANAVVGLAGNGLDNALTGNARANSLAGGDGNDTLDGGAGNDSVNGGAGDDSLAGGPGSDTYVVDSAGDAVSEFDNQGTDLVLAGVTHSLADNVENLTLTGGGDIDGGGNGLNNAITGNSGNNALTGGAGNDVLLGNAGNDTLDGGTGNDVLNGGDGSDRYFVDSALDRVVESNAVLATGGTDEVHATLSYILGANVENLTLTGTGSTSGIGNAAANVLTGNSGNNTLDGRGGVDSFAGGLGDDTYVLDRADELATITEDADAGSDTLRIAYANLSTVTATLTLTGTLANIENIVVTGTGRYDLVGNAAANRLTGNAASNALSGGDGDDTLDGGTGSDTLDGGAGDDSYVIDSTGDRIQDSAGTDTVLARVSYILADGLENLSLGGSLAINGTGNAANNVLGGNAAANVLRGGAGDDIYIAGLGDTVNELIGSAAGGIDELHLKVGQLGNAISSLAFSNLRFSRVNSGRDLRINVGTAGGLTVQGMNATAAMVEVLRLFDAQGNDLYGAVSLGAAFNAAATTPTALTLGTATDPYGLLATAG